MDLESEALREAYAVAPADRAVLDTLEVSRPGQSSIFLTNNFYPFTALLETGASTTFQAIPFKVKLPSKDENVLPTMSVTIANPNQIVSDYLRAATAAKQSITIKFRPFITRSGGASPLVQLPVPMTFHIGSVKYDTDWVEAQCVFPNIANKRFPNETYTIRKFPGLRGW